MNTLDKYLSMAEDFFVGTAIIIAAFVLFINVVTRQLGYSFQWAEEFTRYIIVWITFIGGSICVRKYAHVGIDALVSMMPRKHQRIFEILVYLIGIIFSVVMTILGFELSMAVKQLHQLSPAMMIPMWIPYMGMPLGFGLMSIRYTQIAINCIKGKRSRLDTGGQEL